MNMKRIVQGKYRECLFNCIYCFAKGDYKTNGQHDLSEDEHKSIDIIQPFADFDVFACKDCSWKEDINKYVSYGKILSFATKAYVSDNKASYLSEVNEKLRSKGGFLHIGITITTIDYLNEIEINTPSFHARCRSLMNLQANNIPCSVIIRPVLPLLSKREISTIIDETYLFCSNYIYGPLYMNTAISEYLQSKNIEISTTPHQVNWLNEKPTWQIYHSDRYSEIIDYLITYCKKKNKSVWDSNSNAIEEIKGSIYV